MEESKNSLQNSSLRESMLPIMVVYILIGVVVLGFFTLGRADEAGVWVELVKAAPFAFSAMIVGMFSVLFWALNYLSRNHRSQIKLREAENLFEIRHRAIQKALGEDSNALEEKEKAILATHILFAMSEIPSDPEVPESSIPFNYSDAISQIFKRS